ncbi:endoglucanase [Alicyclobacillus cellulosilyticus]|uniref:Endoglucanase n=1 Tax=Alicyclobacillus cellulosilyticus TaxID=1003997 RepID=A0A917NH36_9BACL|nr:cellulase family glycosylhydrolase [Alicyclobacillus cellulosilyticus]GGJ00652.1 endoglucanase [Alicyclobacillus cellulosilyticus]
MSSTAQTVLPRWRGFNLLEMFTHRHDGNFREDDFRWIAEWGFDFVRIPMSYRLWAPGPDVYDIREEVLEKVDRAVMLGQRYGLHVSLNFHRAPGYCINPGPDEPFDLWKDKEAQEAFCYHWSVFAKRYKGIPPHQLSFDLVNEPPVPSPDGMTLADYERVVRAAVAAIRAVDPDRLIFCEGHSIGNEPCPNLVDLGIAQSCRGYIPAGLTHYRAGWVPGSDKWPEPVWPGATQGGEAWDREKLRRHYAKWADLARQGVGVHCGEMGVYKHTPHHVALAWFRDVLEILREFHIGFAVWNFRGEFGVLDSGRSDVAYEDWYGHKLDRALLTLLQAH